MACDRHALSGTWHVPDTLSVEHGMCSTRSQWNMACARHALSRTWHVLDTRSVTGRQRQDLGDSVKNTAVIDGRIMAHSNN